MQRKKFFGVANFHNFLNISKKYSINNKDGSNNMKLSKMYKYQLFFNLFGKIITYLILFQCQLHLIFQI